MYQAEAEAEEEGRQIQQRDQHREEQQEGRNLKKLFSVINGLKKETDSIIVFFSGGSDSIATLDMCVKHISKVVAIHLYFIPGLSFVEKHFDYYRKRFNITIDQYPFPDVSRIFNSKAFNLNAKKLPKLSLSKIQTFVRKKYNIDWVSYGYRLNDSLQRRGFMTKYGLIDKKNKKVYPVAEWSSKTVMNYLEHEKLPLPISYSYGFRDISWFAGSSLLWLYNNYRDDYNKVKKIYPLIEGELIRAQEGIIE